MSEPARYQSYLLRLWRDDPRTPWQASLQSTATEQIHHFPDVDQMWSFLQAQMATDRDDSGHGDLPPGASEPGAPD